MKNIIVVTGGAGFVGSNLIDLFLKKTKLNIISIDDYSSGSKKNHFKSPRVQYLNSHTKNIFTILKKNQKNQCHFSLWGICKNLSKLFTNE